MDDQNQIQGDQSQNNQQVKNDNQNQDSQIQADQNSQQDENQPIQPGDNKDKVKLLMVEDDELLVKMYSTKLSMEGFKVDKALDGEEAVQKLESGDYDLVLLDLMLPKLDGFSVLEKLRASSWSNAKKPVIVFSNLGQESDIQRAKDLGASDYLVKANLTPNQVVEKIREHLR